MNEWILNNQFEVNDLSDELSDEALDRSVAETATWCAWDRCAPW